MFSRIAAGRIVLLKLLNDGLKIDVTAVAADDGSDLTPKVFLFVLLAVHNFLLVVRPLFLVVVEKRLYVLAYCAFIFSLLRQRKQALAR